MTEEEMVGWYHRLDGHEFGSTPGVGDGQGGLMCCGSWDHKESDTTERLNQTEQVSVEGTIFSSVLFKMPLNDHIRVAAYPQLLCLRINVV